MLKKGLLVVIIIIIIVFLLRCIIIQASSEEIRKTLITEYINSDNEKKDILKKEIILKISKDIGKNELQFDLNESKLEVVLGNVIHSNKEDAIFILKFDNKNSTILVYSETEKGYKFKSKVDDFFNITDLQLINLKNKNKDIIVIRENVEQLLGSFEEGTYIRGYIFNENKFELILNITEEYKAYWNQLWDNDKNIEEKHWLKVYEKSDIVWENKNFPIVKVLRNQSYFSSKAINIKYLPNDKDFNMMKTNKVLREYKWAEEWNCFILEEAEMKETKENVAVLETSEDSPFYITETKKENKYRIKRKNGNIEVIDKDNLKFDK